MRNKTFSQKLISICKVRRLAHLVKEAGHSLSVSGFLLRIFWHPFQIIDHCCLYALRHYIQNIGQDHSIKRVLFHTQNPKFSLFFQQITSKLHRTWVPPLNPDFSDPPVYIPQKPGFTFLFPAHMLSSKLIISNMNFISSLFGSLKFL